MSLKYASCCILFGNHSRQSWDGMTQVIRTISESHADNMPIVIVDCMCDSATSTSFIQARERFVQKAYSVFIENYYAEGEALRGIEAADVPHAPVFYLMILLCGRKLFCIQPEELKKMKG